MNTPRKNSGKHNASMTMENLTAYGVGITTVIFLLGPSYQFLRDPFVGYVVEYYGQVFSGISAVFLFCLLAVLIFSIFTIITHTLSGILRTKMHFFGSLGKF